MAEKNNATCSICGKPYYVCMGCRDTMQLQPWKIHCCSPDCYRTFQVVKGFSTGVYTKDEFKSKLKNINLSNLENYREHIKVLIKDALKEEKPVAKTVEKVKPVVKEVKSVETEVAEVKEEAVVENVVETEKVEDIVKPTVSRKRNYKVNNEVEETE
jgi:hypothetical protein